MSLGEIEKKIIQRLPKEIGPGLGLVLAEEIGREAAESLKEVIPRRLQEVTKSRVLKDHRIVGTEAVVEVERRGGLKELLIVSPSKAFEITLMADGLVKLRGTYDEMMFLSPNLEMIEAYGEVDEGRPTDNYIFRIGGVKWLSSFRILLGVTDTPIVFSRIIAVWDEMFQ